MKNKGIGLFLGIILFSTTLLGGDPEDMSQLINKMGTNEKVTVFFKDTSLKEILHFFSEEYDLNIIMESDFSNKVTFSFKDIHPAKAFDAIISAQKFTWSLDGNLITLSQSLPFHVVKLQYSDAEEVRSSLATIFSRVGDVSVDKQANALIIHSSDSNARKLRAMIKKIDIPPLQVLVRAKILEVQKNNDQNIGVDFIHTESSSSTAENTGFAAEGLAGFFAKTVSGKLSAEVQALETRSNIKTLAEPHIMAINKQSASIITGGRLGYKVTTTTGTLAQETVEFLEIGTKLEFTPQIAKNGDIQMTIKPSVSSGGIVDGLPQTDTTEAVSKVLVKDGETIVIGGLVRKVDTVEKTGIPILVNIPLIGRFFGKTINVSENRDLIILITPTLVTNSPEKH